MALISIDIPTGAATRAKAMAQALGPRLLAPADLPAGKLPADWTGPEAMAVLRAMVKRFVVDCIKQVEAETAAETARATALAKVDTDGLVV